MGDIGAFGWESGGVSRLYQAVHSDAGDNSPLEGSEDQHRQGDDDANFTRLITWSTQTTWTHAHTVIGDDVRIKLHNYLAVRNVCLCGPG